MISPNHPHDRESLSALFDGELQGDASRFAHKRLAQDAQWRQACGTWQLVGDVLRGQATAAAPADFADRIQRELARESAEASTLPAAGTASRRGWIGGAALAASVAVAAWFVATPFEDAPPAAPAETIATATPPAVVPVPAAPQSPPVVAAVEPATRDRASLPPDRSTADPGPRPPAEATVAAVSSPPSPIPAPADSTGSIGIDATALADPFRLPSSQTGVARPWPRAVLPDYPVDRALTARYGGRPQNPGMDALAPRSPTFYPFEPHLPPGTDAAISPEAQGP